MEKDYTIVQVCETWLLYKKHIVKTSTYYKYRNEINRYIIPYFGNKTLKEAEQEDLNKWIDVFMESKQLKSTAYIIVLLKSILKFAERKYDCRFKLDLITVPKNEIKEVEVIERRDRDNLERYCKEDLSNFKNVGFIFCLYTGVRLGEICALTWNDIDLKNGIVYINKTMQRIYVSKNNSYISIDSPKSRSSNRKIPIQKKLLDMLIHIQKTNNFTGEEYFLTGKSDKYLDPRSYQYAFHRALEECNIRKCKFHCLRHTFATNCIEHGMDVKALSVTLGHANVNITLNRYVHSSLDNIKKYLDKL